MSIQVVILAAGQGKRMHSSLSKVLHQLAGKSLIEHVLATAFSISDKKPILIYGHQGQQLKTALQNHDIHWIEQENQLGTGHAVAQAMGAIPKNDRVLILCGDVPLITASTLKRLIQSTPQDQVGMLTAQLQQPYGYGRIIRDHEGALTKIVEEKDASQIEKSITEINTGIYLAPANKLQEWLPSLTNHNAQQEYYLTEIIPLALQQGLKIHSIEPEYLQEILGVNDKIQLAQLERFYQHQITQSLLKQGVTLLDPSRVDIRGNIQIGRDVVIDINVILEGEVIIGDHCVIGPNCILKNTTLGKHVQVKANSMLEGALIGAHAHIGPFARIRPGTTLAKDVHIGNFVEVKNSMIAEGSKANHLTYLGDCEIGQHVNVGAGTITCNYDGANKFKTKIDDHAFIGSGTELVAPVSIGKGATIGAGSTITRDAPANQLTLSRIEQQTVATWRRPQKKNQKRDEIIHRE